MSYLLLPYELKAIIIPDLLTRMLIDQPGYCQYVLEIVNLKHRLKLIGRLTYDYSIIIASSQEYLTVFTWKYRALTCKCPGNCSVTNKWEDCKTDDNIDINSCLIRPLPLQTESCVAELEGYQCIHHNRFYHIESNRRLVSISNPITRLRNNGFIRPSSLSILTLHKFLTIKECPKIAKKEIILAIFRKQLQSKNPIKRLLVIFINASELKCNEKILDQLLTVFEQSKIDRYNGVKRYNFKTHESLFQYLCVKYCSRYLDITHPRWHKDTKCSCDDFPCWYETMENDLKFLKGQIFGMIPGLY